LTQSTISSGKSVRRCDSAFFEIESEKVLEAQMMYLDESYFVFLRMQYKRILEKY
jgi:hypothetical protein